MIEYSIGVMNMAKKKKKKKLKWGRVFIALIIVIVLIFGIYKSASFLIGQAIDLVNDLLAGEKISTKKYRATIIIDPGHGGYDVGANTKNIYEKDITLKTAQYLQKALEKKNIKVVLTRDKDIELNSDKSTDLHMRAAMSQQNQADYFVSIHVNDFANNNSVSGFEVYTRNNDSYSLAESILTKMDALKISKNRGIVDGSNLQVLRDNTVPSVLVELGYIKSSDFQYLTNDSQLNNIAGAIANGLEERIKEDKEVKNEGENQGE